MVKETLGDDWLTPDLFDLARARCSRCLNANRQGRRGHYPKRGLLLAAVIIYLDNSVLNRPFDDCSHPRVWLEAICFIFVLQMIEEAKRL